MATFSSFIPTSHTQRDARVFAALVAQEQPAVYEHLGEMDIHPLMYVTQWFMCAFTSLPAWDTTLAIWDAIFLNGESMMGFVDSVFIC